MSNKGPPSRLERFISLALEVAEDETHGYSQKPPSGRWGPDFDCSSLIYYLANRAGYNVGAGPDKVRFTGTMLKDFEKAGFQILPFANVGISDLKVGDILLNLALHAEVYVGNGETVGATSSENGGYTGDSGDQTDHEIEKHPAASFTKEWDYILRPPVDEENVEGDDDMTIPNQTHAGMYNNPPGYSQGGMQNNPRPWPYPQGNPMPTQGTGNWGGPQGSYTQANGYSQGNAGYMSESSDDLIFVMGIEGAKNRIGIPNTREAVFDEDKPLMYVVDYGSDGRVNNMHVYQFTECSEQMPQHTSPLMRHNQNNSMNSDNFVTRQEWSEILNTLNSLKEMMTSGQPITQAVSAEPNGSTQPGVSQSANAGRSR